MTQYVEHLVVFLLILLLFFEPPLFFIERYSLQGLNKPIVLAVTLFLSILLLRNYSIPKTAAQLAFVFILQASLLLLLPFLHQTFGYGFDGGYFSVAFQVLAGLALFLVFASAGQVSLLAKFWVHLHLVIGACSLLVFVGGIAVNLEPVGTFSNRPYYDFGLAYTNVFYQVGGVKLIRAAGFYDEPGTFAFYTTFALLLARAYGMAKWKELALIGFGLTSLSMAFIVVVTVWLLLGADRKQYKYAVVASIGLLFAFSRIDNDVGDLVYDATIDRFSLSSAKGRLLRGDNRSAIMASNYEAFLDAPFIGHGVHYDDYVGGRYSSSFIANPIAPLATHGLFGASIVNIHIFVLLLLLARTKVLPKRDKIVILIILLATLAQRPTTIHGLNYVLFVIMIYRLLGSDSATYNPSPVRARYSLVPATHARR